MNDTDFDDVLRYESDMKSRLCPSLKNDLRKRRPEAPLLVRPEVAVGADPESDSRNRISLEIMTEFRLCLN